MKKMYMLVALSGMATSLMAQSFSDDFESYAPGDYIGVQNTTWTTWSGTTGGAEDAQVTTNNASSGTQSIYFTSTSANGGPQDVVLPFPGELNSGLFVFNIAMFVETNKGAYFNFQGETAIGTSWALDFQVRQDGSATISNSGLIRVSTTVPMNQWFDMVLTCDLSTNNWSASIDGNSLGSWSNTLNQVASLDLFPVNNANAGGNNQSGFYVDDVAYTYTPYTLLNRNGAVTGVSMPSVGLAGQDREVEVTVRNLGTTNITSFDVVIDYNGNQFTETVSGVNLASYDYHTFTTSNMVTLASGPNTLTASIANVNGSGADDDTNDDSRTMSLNPIVPAAGKMVIGEEATGTWCGWCPRGAVAMEQMALDYDGLFQGIAVHNNDPMADVTYDAGMGNLIGGYPSSLVDRGADIDPSVMYVDFLSRIQLAPSAFITNGATWDAANRVLNISVTADWQTAASGDWRIACVLVEDSVTGSGSGYNQTNYYAGGGNGQMGGYEALPDPVPAASMVYDDVARLISPGFDGFANSFPASVSNGESYTFNFSFQIPTGWDENRMTIVGMLIAPDGTIDNAGAATISEAQTNGYQTGTNVTGTVGVSQFDAPDAKINLYPNPATQVSYVGLQLDQAENVNIRVIGITGQVVAQKNYGMLEGSYTLPIALDQMANGIYLIEITVGETVQTERLIVE